MSSLSETKWSEDAERFVQDVFSAARASAEASLGASASSLAPLLAGARSHEDVLEAGDELPLLSASGGVRSAVLSSMSRLAPATTAAALGARVSESGEVEWPSGARGGGVTVSGGAGGAGGRAGGAGDGVLLVREEEVRAMEEELLRSRAASPSKGRRRSVVTAGVGHGMSTSESESALQKVIAAVDLYAQERYRATWGPGRPAHIPLPPLPEAKTPRFIPMGHYGDAAHESGLTVFDLLDVRALDSLPREDLAQSVRELLAHLHRREAVVALLKRAYHRDVFVLREHLFRQSNSNSDANSISTSLQAQGSAGAVWEPTYRAGMPAMVELAEVLKLFSLASDSIPVSASEYRSLLLQARQAASLERENAELRSYSRSLADRHARLSATAQDVAGTVDGVDAERRRAVEVARALRRQLGEAEEELQRVRGSEARLRNELDSTSERVATVDAKLATMRRELAEARAVASVAERERDDALSRETTLRDDLRAAREAIEEMLPRLLPRAGDGDARGAGAGDDEDRWAHRRSPRAGRGVGGFLRPVNRDDDAASCGSLDEDERRAIAADARRRHAEDMRAWRRNGGIGGSDEDDDDDEDDDYRPDDDDDDADTRPGADISLLLPSLDKGDGTAPEWLDIMDEVLQDAEKEVGVPNDAAPLAPAEGAELVTTGKPSATIRAMERVRRSSTDQRTSTDTDQPSPPQSQSQSRPFSPQSRPFSPASASPQKARAGGAGGGGGGFLSALQRVSSMARSSGADDEGDVVVSESPASEPRPLFPTESDDDRAEHRDSAASAIMHPPATSTPPDVPVLPELAPRAATPAAQEREGANERGDDDDARPLARQASQNAPATAVATTTDSKDAGNDWASDGSDGSDDDGDRPLPAPRPRVPSAGSALPRVNSKLLRAMQSVSSMLPRQAQDAVASLVRERAQSSPKPDAQAEVGEKRDDGVAEDGGGSDNDNDDDDDKNDDESAMGAARKGSEDVEKEAVEVWDATVDLARAVLLRHEGGGKDEEEEDGEEEDGEGGLGRKNVTSGRGGGSKTGGRTAQRGHSEDSEDSEDSEEIVVTEPQPVAQSESILKGTRRGSIGGDVEKGKALGGGSVLPARTLGGPRAAPLTATVSSIRGAPGEDDESALEALAAEKAAEKQRIKEERRAQRRAEREARRQAEREARERDEQDEQAAAESRRERQRREEKERRDKEEEEERARTEAEHKRQLALLNGEEEVDVEDEEEWRKARERLALLRKRSVAIFPWQLQQKERAASDARPATGGAPTEGASVSEGGKKIASRALSMLMMTRQKSTADVVADAAGKLTGFLRRKRQNSESNGSLPAPSPASESPSARHGAGAVPVRTLSTMLGDLKLQRVDSSALNEGPPSQSRERGTLGTIGSGSSGEDTFLVSGEGGSFVVPSGGGKGVEKEGGKEKGGESASHVQFSPEGGKTPTESKMAGRKASSRRPRTGSTEGDGRERSGSRGGRRDSQDEGDPSLIKFRKEDVLLAQRAHEKALERLKAASEHAEELARALEESEMRRVKAEKRLREAAQRQTDKVFSVAHAASSMRKRLQRAVEERKRRDEELLQLSMAVSTADAFAKAAREEALRARDLARDEVRAEAAGQLERLRAEAAELAQRADEAERRCIALDAETAALRQAVESARTLLQLRAVGSVRSMEDAEDGEDLVELVMPGESLSSMPSMPSLGDARSDAGTQTDNAAAALPPHTQGGRRGSVVERRRSSIEALQASVDAAARAEREASALRDQVGWMRGLLAPLLRRVARAADVLIPSDDLLSDAEVSALQVAPWPAAIGLGHTSSANKAAERHDEHDDGDGTRHDSGDLEDVGDVGHEEEDAQDGQDESKSAAPELVVADVVRGVEERVDAASARLRAVWEALRAERSGREAEARERKSEREEGERERERWKAAAERLEREVSEAKQSALSAQGELAERAQMANALQQERDALRQERERAVAAAAASAATAAALVEQGKAEAAARAARRVQATQTDGNSSSFSSSSSSSSAAADVAAAAAAVAAATETAVAEERAAWEERVREMREAVNAAKEEARRAVGEADEWRGKVQGLEERAAAGEAEAEAQRARAEGAEQEASDLNGYLRKCGARPPTPPTPRGFQHVNTQTEPAPRLAAATPSLDLNAALARGLQDHAATARARGAIPAGLAPGEFLLSSSRSGLVAAVPRPSRGTTAASSLRSEKLHDSHSDVEPDSRLHRRRASTSPPSDRRALDPDRFLPTDDDNAAENARNPKYQDPHEEVKLRSPSPPPALGRESPGRLASRLQSRERTDGVGATATVTARSRQPSSPPPVFAPPPPSSPLRLVMPADARTATDLQGLQGLQGLQDLQDLQTLPTLQTLQTLQTSLPTGSLPSLVEPTALPPQTVGTVLATTSASAALQSRPALDSLEAVLQASPWDGSDTGDGSASHAQLLASSLSSPSLFPPQSAWASRSVGRSTSPKFRATLQPPPQQSRTGNGGAGGIGGASVTEAPEPTPVVLALAPIAPTTSSSLQSQSHFLQSQSQHSQSQSHLPPPARSYQSTWLRRTGLQVLEQHRPRGSLDPSVSLSLRLDPLLQQSQSQVSAASTATAWSDARALAAGDDALAQAASEQSAASRSLLLAQARSEPVLPALSTVERAMRRTVEAQVPGVSVDQWLQRGGFDALPVSHSAQDAGRGLGPRATHAPAPDVDRTAPDVDARRKAHHADWIRRLRQRGRE